MGQYLTFSIITQRSASKEEAQKGNISFEELQERMQTKLAFESDIYDLTENESYWRWSLQPNLISEQLIPLLKEIYDFLGIAKGGKEVIDYLEKTDKTNWEDLAKDASFYNFQSDDYSSPDWLYFDKDFRPKMMINYSGIMLYMEGKIMMEEYGTLFRFFDKCVHKTFDKYPLAKALKTYITG